MRRRSFLVGTVGVVAGTAGCIQDEPDGEEERGLPGIDQDAFEVSMAEEGLEARLSRYYFYELQVSYETVAETDAEHRADAETTVTLLAAAIDDPEHFEQVGVIYVLGEGPGADNEVEYQVQGEWLLDLTEGNHSAESVVELAIEAAEPDVAVDGVDVDTLEAALASEELELEAVTHDGATVEVAYQSLETSPGGLEAEVPAVVEALVTAMDDLDSFEDAVDVVHVSAFSIDGNTQIGYTVESAWLLDVEAGERSAEEVAELAFSS